MERRRRELETDLVSHRGDDGEIRAEPVPEGRSLEGAPEPGELEPERAGDDAAGDATD